MIISIIEDISDGWDIFKSFFNDLIEPATDNADGNDVDVNNDIPVGLDEFRQNMNWVGVDIPDAVGIDTRDYMLANYINTDGTWTDPYTGFTSDISGDFDIDHMISIDEIADNYPEIGNLSREEMLEIYNDQDNLQVLHDGHNRIKGNTPWREYANEIENNELREEFIRRCREFIDKLNERFGR